ncbi:MAG: RidA family protein [Actinomycetota bacterium]
MHRELTPQTVGPPSANYALATLSDGADRWLHTSGIGPVRPDGTVPEDLAEQAEAVWSTLLSLIDEAGLALTDVVSVTTYAVQGDDLSGDLGVIMAARDQALGGHRCASILVPVPALATPSWRMEIAVVAAGAG